jgi:hypothetical protein
MGAVLLGEWIGGCDVWVVVSELWRQWVEELGLAITQGGGLEW